MRCRSQQPPPSREGNAATLGTDVINEIPDLTLIMRLQSWEGRGYFCFREKATNKGTFSPNPHTSCCPPQKSQALWIRTPPLSFFFAKVFAKMKPGDAPKEDVATGPKGDVLSTYLDTGITTKGPVQTLPLSAKLMVFIKKQMDVKFRT